jgi:hypothetical protein
MPKITTINLSSGRMVDALTIAVAVDRFMAYRSVITLIALALDILLSYNTF